jgi:hypothetical protein
MTKQTAPRTRPKKGKPPEGGLQIDVGWQLDGGVYQLDLASIRKIQKAFPDAAIVGDMLIGYAKTMDYRRFHQKYWQQIAQILTGLTPEQIGQLGGIRIFDPAADSELWAWQPRGANGE